MSKTPAEFILWLKGFLDAIGDTLDARQVGKIREQFEMIDATPSLPPISAYRAEPPVVQTPPHLNPTTPSLGELPTVVRMG